MKKLLFIIFLLPLSSTINSQSKLEREYRLKSTQVPKKALDFIHQCNFQKKIKWYAEQSQNGKSIEAKTKHHNQKYSIEFDTLGNLQDVEITIKWDAIQSKVQQRITQHLDSTFKTYKIIKIQAKYSGNTALIITFIQTNISTSALTLKYEIELQGRIETSTENEYTFTDIGIFEQSLQIIRSNTDNLEY